MISQVELCLYPNKLGTPEEDQRIQRPKLSEIKNKKYIDKHEDNSPKTLADKNDKYWKNDSGST